MTDITGLTVLYQGYVCSPIFEIQRTAGLEPDFAYVYIDKRSLGKLIIKDIPGGVDSIAPGTDTPDAGSAGGGLYVAGELQIRETRPDGSGGSDGDGVTFHNMLLSEKTIESVIEADDGTGSIKIELTDIRRLWADRGFVFGWINIQRRVFQTQNAADANQSAGVGPGSSGTTGVAGESTLDQLFAEYERVIGLKNVYSAFQNSFFGRVQGSPGLAPQTLQPSGIEVGALLPQSIPRTQDAGNTTYVPGSVNNDSPFTLKQVLEKFVLPALPGKPKLKGMSPDLENFIPGEHKWEGALAKEAFRELLDEAGAVVALNPDCSVSVWKKGSGPCQDEDGGVITNKDARLAAVRLLMSHRHVPRKAVVVGLPIVETFEEDLVPCGEIDGHLVPLSQALVAIGAPARYVFLEHEKRAALTGVSEEGLRQFERWAFKWYTFADNLANRSTGRIAKLPIEDQGETDLKGIRKEPVVQAESCQPIDYPMAKRYGRAAAIKAQLNADRLSGLVDEDGKPFKHVFRVSAESTAITALEREASGDNIGMFNVSMRPQPGQYEIDRDRGVVMFRAPRCTVVKQGYDPSRSTPQAAKVKLRYGASRKAKFDGQLNLDDRYRSFWENVVALGTESEDLSPAATEIAPDSKFLGAFEQKNVLGDASSYLPILAPLQELHGLNQGTTDASAPPDPKKTNKATLDSQARKLVEQRLGVPSFVAGAVFEFCRPVNLVNTGRVLSISWTFIDGEGPRVTAHDSQYAPLSRGQLGDSVSPWSFYNEGFVRYTKLADGRFMPLGDL